MSQQCSRQSSLSGLPARRLNAMHIAKDSPGRFRHRCPSAALLCLVLFAGSSFAEPGPQKDSSDATLNTLKQMDLGELMNVEVTTVSRQESTVGQSPAAVFVITPEMIRRSGATSIPEALRMVPGMEVTRGVENGGWLISIRGFNSIPSTKLLVLIDGRSVYNPFSAGVFWDVQDTLMEDIERIEIVRGPGGSLWGAN